MREENFATYQASLKADHARKWEKEAEAKCSQREAAEARGSLGFIGKKCKVHVFDFWLHAKGEEELIWIHHINIEDGLNVTIQTYIGTKKNDGLIDATLASSVITIWRITSPSRCMCSDKGKRDVDITEDTTHVNQYNLCTLSKRCPPYCG